MKYLVISNLNHNGEEFQKDDVIILEDEQADSLLQAGVIEHVKELTSEDTLNAPQAPDESTPQEPAAPEAPATEPPLTPPAPDDSPAQPPAPEEAVSGQPTPEQIAAALASTETPSQPSVPEAEPTVGSPGEQA